jgi:acetyl esterase/lipase
LPYPPLFRASGAWRRGCRARSAGGGLALAAALELRDRGELPRCLALICPFVDLGPDASWRTGDTSDPLLTLPHTLVFGQEYAGGPSVDPRVSPLRGNLAGLPPLIVHTAGDDLLHADGTELVARARAAGLAVEHYDVPGMWHDFHALAGLLAAGDHALAALVESILRT